MSYFNSAEREAIGPGTPVDTPLDAGNGYLMREGWTVVWTGWQADAPRLSIEERYKGRASYLSAVKKAAEMLAERRLIRAEDIEPSVARAASRWEVFTRGKLRSATDVSAAQNKRKTVCFARND